LTFQIGPDLAEHFQEISYALQRIGVPERVPQTLPGATASARKLVGR
jgi:hypothetical protein